MPDQQIMPAKDVIRDLSRLATTEFRARAAAHESEGTLPLENLRQVHDLGLLHATVTRVQGGLGGSLTGEDPALFLQLLRTICHGDASTGHCFQVHNHAFWMLEELATPAQVSELVALIENGELTDRLARQVLEGVIAGEGTPRDVVASRGLVVVSDDTALIAAIDAALAEQPDVLEKIREGKVQAAGAIIGAVMKAMGGQADAARVRELVLERAGLGQ